MGAVGVGQRQKAWASIGGRWGGVRAVRVVRHGPQYFQKKEINWGWAWDQCGNQVEGLGARRRQ